MNHDWFKTLKFEQIQSQLSKAPFLPDKEVVYIDDEFFKVDVKNANQPSPINSDDENIEDDILKDFDYERN